MDLKNLKENLQSKVNSLEQTRKIQQNYIKHQFNTGRNKGYKDQQKIKAWLSYTRLFIISFLAAAIVPIIMIKSLYAAIDLAIITQTFFIALGIWALIMNTKRKHDSHLNDINKWR
jgi:hypothetical protein